MAGADLPIPWMGQTAALAALVVVACLTTPAPALSAAWSANRWTAAAFIGLMLWAGLTALPLPEAWRSLTHPMAIAPDGEAIAAAISLAPTATGIGLLKLAGIAAAFLLGALAGAEPHARSLAVRATLVALTLYGLLCLAGFATNATRRLDGGLPSANVTAALFGCAGILAAAALVRAERMSDVYVPGIFSPLRGLIAAPLSSMTALVALTCLMLTGSRGGVIMSAVAAVVLGLALGRSRRSQRTGPSAGVIGFVVGLVLLGAASLAPLRDRLADGTQALDGRQTLIMTHLGAALERPLYGHGLGAYAQVNSQLVTLENRGALMQAGAAHNVVVQTIEEVGLIGFALWLAALAPVFARIFWPRGTVQREWRAAALAITTLLVVHAQADITLQTHAVSVFFAFLLGLLTPAPAIRDDG